MSDKHLAEEAESGRTPTDEFRDFVTAEIGPLLAGRDLREGGSFVTACHEIADALAPWVVPMAVKAAQRDRMVERDRTVLDEVERRIQAWIRHGEAVPADVTTYDRSIVHHELRALIEEARHAV